MAYEIRENTGSTFKNQKKETDKHPNVTGSCLIDGKEYWMSGWTKQDKNGNPWQSWAFKLKEAKQEEKPKQQPKNHFEDMSDDIPFLFNVSTLCDTLGSSKSLMRAKHGPKVLSILQSNKTDC